MSPQTKTQKSIIRVNLPQILDWVDEGFTLKSIHKSLEEDRILKCRYAHFVRCLDELKEIGISPRPTNIGDCRHSSEQDRNIRMHPATEVNPSKERPNRIGKKPIIEGFDLEKQQRIAAYAFEQAGKG